MNLTVVKSMLTFFVGSSPFVKQLVFEVRREGIVSCVVCYSVVVILRQVINTAIVRDITGDFAGSSSFVVRPSTEERRDDCVVLCVKF